VLEDQMLTLLTSVSAMVDQLGAEFKDPETTQSRKEEIREQLTQLYDELKKYERPTP
jgi:hypothetical protein